MIILAIDTALETCSAAIVKDGAALAARSEPMARGHQERLAPLVAEVAAQAGIRFAAVDLIAATTGPGSFTGLRVGLAFAKGLATALGRPAAGVGVLEAMGAETTGFAAAVIDARRDQVYVQAFRDAAPLAGPQALSVPDAIAMLESVEQAGPTVLTGPGAGLLASAFPGARVTGATAPDPVTVARLAASAPHGLAPVYLRAPDAKLPASALSPGVSPA